MQYADKIRYLENYGKDELDQKYGKCYTKLLACFDLSKRYLKVKQKDNVEVDQNY